MKIFHQDTKTFLEIRNRKQGHEYYFCNFVFSSIKKKKVYDFETTRLTSMCGCLKFCWDDLALKAWENASWPAMKTFAHAQTIDRCVLKNRVKLRQCGRGLIKRKKGKILKTKENRQAANKYWTHVYLCCIADLFQCYSEVHDYRSGGQVSL